MNKGAESTMKKYTEMSREELLAEQSAVKAQYDAYKAEGLSLNMARGKPSKEQEKVSLPVLDVLNSKSDFSNDENVDVLNYGNLEGLKECRMFYSDLLGADPDKIIIGGNSSLSLMFDYIMQCYAKGASEETEPWILQGDVKFLCPVPGYDRHFGILEYMGIDMINVPMTDEGPDMDVVEELVKDPMVKGMFCVPKYSNPTGCTYSDDVVRRIAAMDTAAPDFRVIWDNAYCIHDFDEHGDTLLDIIDETVKAGHPERAVEFASTSKVTFSGSGISVIAANEPNYSWIKKRLVKQTIGSDKINQLRHSRYFQNFKGVHRHMMALAAIIKPHFDVVLTKFDEELDGLGIARWTKPNGGYFISLDVMEGCAQRTWDLCKEAGVTLTNCGATFPYGKDPKDENIRIAPTYPSLEELAKATDVLMTSIKLACLEKLLAA